MSFAGDAMRQLTTIAALVVALVTPAVARSRLQAIISYKLGGLPGQISPAYNWSNQPQIDRGLPFGALSPTQIPQAVGVLLGSPLTARLPINFRHDSWFAIVNISQYLFVTDDPVIQRHRHIRKAGPCTRRYEHSATRCQRGTCCPWHFAGKEI